MNELGQNILQLLKEKNMTQEQLARKIGITPVSVSRYVNGTRTPSAPLIKKISKALETDVDYFFDGKAKETDGRIKLRDLIDLIDYNREGENEIIQICEPGSGNWDEYTEFYTSSRLIDYFEEWKVKEIGAIRENCIRVSIEE